MSAMRRSPGVVSLRALRAGLGAVAVSLLTWFAGPLLAIADHRPLETATARLTFLALLVGAVLMRWRWSVWSRRRAEATVAENRADAPSSPPLEMTATAELQALHARFASAMTVLRSARLGATGPRGLLATIAALSPSRYIYDLPWYVLIGSPGSGKTTALLHSGLRFPLAEKMEAQRAHGTGGAPHCDWWFSDRAVLIDTAGRYTTEASELAADKCAWKNLVALLKKHRPSRPVNGVIVTVSVADLLDADQQRREHLAASVRGRLLELHDALHIRVPVYVLVTKIDLLVGFNELFAGLGQDERAQVWGTTFPFPESSGSVSPTATLDDELAALEERLNGRLIDRMQQERDLTRRAAVYCFPQQFAALRPRLVAFSNQAFADSRFAQAGLLRGVYFTSGMQEGTPLDPVLGGVARSLGLASRGLPPLPASGRSFFLDRLLHEVVFRESALAGIDRKVERRDALLHAGVLALSVVLATGAIAYAWASYARNRDYVAAVSDRVPLVAQRLAQGKVALGGDALTLLPALDALRRLADTPPEESRAAPAALGLDQSAKLGRAAEHAYQRMLRDALLPVVRGDIESRLRESLLDWPESQYDALKAYLMLATPERFDAAWLRQDVLAGWERALPRALPEETRRALATHLDALLAQAPVFSPVAIDAELVAKARDAVARIPGSQRLYDSLRRDPAVAAMPERTLVTQGGHSALLIFARASGAPLTRGVPALYTLAVYRGAFARSLDVTADRLAEEQPWVLGAASGMSTYPAPEVLRDQVRRLYLQDYAAQWEAFVRDLRIRRTTGLADSIQLAAALAAPDSPLPLLLGEIVTQVTLVPPAEEAPETLVDKAAAVIAGTRRVMQIPGDDAVARRTKLERALVDQRFDALRQFVRGAHGRPAALDQVAPLMGELYQHLVSVDTAMKRKMPPPPPDVMTKVGAEARRMPEPLGATLAQLAEQATRSQRDVAIHDLNTQFAPIAEECAKAIQGRYPFARASASDVLPEDFGRLFGPNGRLDGFVHQDLVKHVDIGARTWMWRRTGELAVATTSEGLRQLQRAQAIRDVFFRADGSRPALRLDFKPLQMDDSITQFVLDVDGQMVRYAHGPQVPIPVQWPGPRGNRQVRVQLAPDANGAASALVFEGPWALFRMLDRMQVESTSQPERVHVTFDLGGRKAVFEVTASSVQSPFRLRDLEQFRCPSRL
jgi:type VI secretion system protein ImpL